MSKRFWTSLSQRLCIKYGEPRQFSRSFMMKEMPFSKSVIRTIRGGISFETWIMWINDLTIHLIFLMYYQFSRRHLTSNSIGYNFMLSLNFRFTARFVPLKVYCGHGHLLQLPPAPPLPHTMALFSYQEEPFCLLCIYHRVSVYLLDTIQTLLTYLYYETESSEFFSNTHMWLVLC